MYEVSLNNQSRGNSLPLPDARTVDCCTGRLYLNLFAFLFFVHSKIMYTSHEMCEMQISNLSVLYCTVNR